MANFIILKCCQLNEYLFQNNFSTLLAEMRAAFGTRFMLTAAVAASGTSVDLSYDVPKLSQYVYMYTSIL